MMMDGMGMMGMMIWGLLTFLFGLLVLFLFILAAAYGVKWVWGQKPSSANVHDESALDLLRSDMREAKSAWESSNGSKAKSNSSDRGRILCRIRLK